METKPFIKGLNINKVDVEKDVETRGNRILVVLLSWNNYIIEVVL